MSDEKITDLMDEISSVPALRDFESNLSSALEDAVRQIFDYAVREAMIEIWANGDVLVWTSTFDFHVPETRRVALSTLVQAAVDDDGHRGKDFAGLESELRKSLEILEKRLAQGEG